jgi:thiamine biosynthesis lipoprotein
MLPVTLARHAMATRFELVLHGDNPAALRAAGEEALDEIDRLENQLSLYRPGSEIAQVNARAAHESVGVTPEVFALLQHAQRLHAETGGAFDITIAPLMRCWGFMDGTGRVPTPEELAEARSKVGMRHLQLDPQNRTVRFARHGVMLDLGAIGKGYAVGQAAEILRAGGLTSALMHGGTSTVYAIGSPPGESCWQVAIETPPAAIGAVAFPKLPAVPLHDEAMSVSATWGRFFESGGRSFGHVIDPCTGQPVNRSLLAMVALSSAMETDALSTALLTLGPDGQGKLSSKRSGMRTLMVAPGQGSLSLSCTGVLGMPAR